MKRVFLVHGWSGSPDNNWFPWLSEQLRNKGFRAEAPAMPNTDAPQMSAWVQALAAAVGTPDEETFFVGHSIGCQTILRYFETIQAKVGGAVLVAPWYTLNLAAEPESEAIARPWIETPMNEIGILNVCPHIECIFSDNDQFVPLENVEKFKHHFNAKIVMEHGKGHLDNEAGITQLPSALNAILLFTKHS